MPTCAKGLALGCRACSVRSRSDMKVLSDPDIGSLSHGIRRFDYAAGETVFAMGEANQGLHCIAAGVIAVRKLGSDGQEVLLSLSYPGEILGYRSLLCNTEHKTGAEALGPAVICRIDQAVVMDVLRRNQAFGLQLLRRAARDVDDAHETILKHATLSNRDRLLHLLVVLLDRHSRTDVDGSLSLELPVSRRDLASMVGTRQETLSRIIGRIESEGLAAFSGRRVRVPKLAPLLRELEANRAA